MTHKDGLTDQEYAELQALAEKHDKKARKDATINMRVSSQLLEDIKACAQAEGYPRYQTWLTMALEVMVAESQKKDTRLETIENTFKKLLIEKLEAEKRLLTEKIFPDVKLLVENLIAENKLLLEEKLLEEKLLEEKRRA